MRDGTVVAFMVVALFAGAFAASIVAYEFGLERGRSSSRLPVFHMVCTDAGCEVRPEALQEVMEHYTILPTHAVESARTAIAASKGER